MWLNARFGIIDDEEKKKVRAAKFGIAAEETKPVSADEIESKKAARASRWAILLTIQPIIIIIIIIIFIINSDIR